MAMATTADSLAAQADQAYLDAQTLADRALDESSGALTTADAAVAGIDTIARPAQQGVPHIAPGSVNKPAAPTGFSTEVQQAFDYAFDAFNGRIQPQIQNYLTTFFPDIAETLKTGSDQWLVDTITNGRYVPADVETALWGRAKEREVIEAGRAEADFINAGAARGFSAPPGVVNASVANIQEELVKKLTGINRDIAIKSFDIANENAKFAIGEAVALRTAFVAALGDFIKMASQGPNDAVDYARVIMDAKKTFYDSATQLYSAEVDEERLRTSVLLENNSIDLRAGDINTREAAHYWDSRARNAKVQADVAVAAAEVLARVAAAAMATRNSVVSVAASV